MRFLARWLHLHVRVVSLAALLLAVTRGVAADVRPTTYALNWVRAEGAEQCASSQELGYAVDQLFGPLLRPPAEASLAIEGFIAQPQPGRFRVTVRVLTPAGEVLGTRTLERAASDCAALTPTLVLLLTMAIDPDATDRVLPMELLARLGTDTDPGAALLAELAEAPPRAELAAPPRMAPAEVPHTKATRSATGQRWRGALELGAGVAAGLLPRASGTLALRAEARSPSRITLAGGLRYAGRADAHADVSGERDDVWFRALQGELWACAPFAPERRLELVPCLGGVLGARFVDASALATPRDQRSVYGGPGAQLALRYALGVRWYAGLEVASALPLPRVRFSFGDLSDTQQPLFSTPALALWSALSAGVRL